MVTPSPAPAAARRTPAPHAHWACTPTPSTKSPHPTSANTAPLGTFCLAPVFQEWGRGRRGGWSTQRVLSQVRALHPSPGDLPHSSSRALPSRLCPRPCRSPGAPCLNNPISASPSTSAGVCEFCSSLKAGGIFTAQGNEFSCKAGVPDAPPPQLVSQDCREPGRT